MKNYLIGLAIPLCLSSFLFGQGLSLQGKLVNKKDNKPLSGCSVVLSNPSNTVTSDAQGGFVIGATSIDGPDGASSLIRFSEQALNLYIDKLVFVSVDMYAINGEKIYTFLKGNVSGKKSISLRLPGAVGKLNGLYFLNVDIGGKKHVYHTSVIQSRINTTSLKADKHSPGILAKGAVTNESIKVTCNGYLPKTVAVINLEANLGILQMQKIPNVIIFLADDMGLGDMSAYQKINEVAEEHQVKTPHFDSLAAAGTMFTDAHAPSSVCTPTRYAMLTGRYAWRSNLKAGVLDPNNIAKPLIEEGRRTIMHMFKDMGYRTAGIGKWHLGTDHAGINSTIAGGAKNVDWSKPVIKSMRQQLGTDYYFGIVANLGTSNQPSNPPGFSVFVENEGYIDPPKNGKNLSPSFYDKPLGQWFLDQARNWIDTSDASKPFALYYAPLANHTPIYPADTIDGIQVKGATGFKSDKSGKNRPDCVYENSVVIGQLVKFLKEKGHWDNTIFVFTSDNGANRHKHPFTPTKNQAQYPESGGFTDYKASIAEGGHRVPTVVTWPDGDVPAGKVSGALWGLNDLYGSFAHMLGYPLKNEEAEDTWNVLDAILGKVDKSARPPLVHHNDNGEFLSKNSKGAIAIRNEQFKLVFDGDLVMKGNANKPVALFDMKNNPKVESLSNSSINLINNSNHSAVIDSLKARAKAYYDNGRSR